MDVLAAPQRETNIFGFFGVRYANREQTKYGINNHQERNNYHQPRNDRHEEDEAESNTPSKRTGRVNAPPREPKASNARWEVEIKAMKDRMDLMMNAMK